MEVMTNKKFSEDEFFKACCKEANVEATMRQASKFRIEKGSAFKVKKHVAKKLAAEAKEQDKK